MLRRILVPLVVLSTLASVSYADKSGASNIESCKRFYAEINKGNLAIFDELLAAGFVENEALPGFPSTKDGVKQFFTMMRNAFPDLTFDVKFYMADGDKVAAYATMSGTHKGEFMGMAGSGKKISVTLVDIIRFEKGKAVEHWGATDSMAMMEQLGMGEPHGH